MNFVRGITETSKQTYKHLSKLLKPLPLETPTKIELAPGNVITVTMFDANHCVGSVMFLIQSSTASVLYTGDIRAEAWWVDALSRHPLLLPYVPPPRGTGAKRLDNIYLDTTFAIKSSPYRKFPSKAEGLVELLLKLERYPPEAQFYFHAWTFGYEEVMLTLAHTLNSRIHLDPYRYRIYGSLGSTSGCGSGLQCQLAAPFCGFMVGNLDQPGILTGDTSVRLHSCEVGTGCWATEPSANGHVVHIKPVVSRHLGGDIAEMGLGGGQGDLDQVHILDLGDTNSPYSLIGLCDQMAVDDGAKQQIKENLRELIHKQGGHRGRIRIDPYGHTNKELTDSLKLHEIAEILQRQARSNPTVANDTQQSSDLITFPYSRHSSYEELRLLVGTLKPRSIFPCTAPSPSNFIEERSMLALFGDVCRRDEHDQDVEFEWDAIMRVQRQSLTGIDEHLHLQPLHSARPPQSPNHQGPPDTEVRSPSRVIVDPENERAMAGLENAETQRDVELSGDDSDLDGRHYGFGSQSNQDNDVTFYTPNSDVDKGIEEPSSFGLDSATRLQVRHDAYKAALEGRWESIHLVSTSSKWSWIEHTL